MRARVVMHLGVPVALEDLRRDGRGQQAQPRADRLLDLRGEVREGADRARELAERDRRPARGRAASRWRCSSACHSAIFRPKVIGSAWTPWVRPIIGACLWRKARSRTASIRSTEVGADEVAGVAHQDARARCPRRPRR